MKYCLLFLSLLSCPALLWSAPEPERRIDSPEYSKSLPGSAKLSNGIYWDQKQESAFEISLSAFFAGQGIPANLGQPARKNVTLEIRQVSSIPQIPEDALHGYSIEISPSRITICYTTPLAESLACRQLMRMIVEQNATRKKNSIPCCEIRDWQTGVKSGAFRWTGPESVVPLDATAVEMMLIDPVRGWVGADRVLQAVGYEQPLYTGNPLTYDDIDVERKTWMDRGIAVIPTFDLTGKNERFEEVTGHPMLSVEGMRFVQLLLDAFFASTGATSVAFIVPSGRYRDQLREFVARYPQITDPVFSDE